MKRLRDIVAKVWKNQENLSRFTVEFQEALDNITKDDIESNQREYNKIIFKAKVIERLLNINIITV